MTEKMPFLYRCLELIPGICTWATLLGAIALSIVNPLLAFYAIIAFDL